MPNFAYLNWSVDVVASQIISYNITGRVLNASGVPIAGAIVSCYGCHDTKYTLTDSTGNYNFTQMHNNFTAVLLAGLSGYIQNETVVSVSGTDVNKDFILENFNVIQNTYEVDKKMLAETLLLIGFIFILAFVKKNFFVPAAGAAYSAWFGLTQIDHTNSSAFLLSGMVILLISACGYSFLMTFDKN
ncbi:MAG: carboxypeptidase-like regulatory domain-containing protein [Candidatus Methanoperedens sp.]|nr:carboxypeptidase-like regulatory domain-containing protein [Candidatus Methanoperedens sp.]